MSKAIAEQSNRLNIFWLKKNGYLNRDDEYIADGITWNKAFSDSNVSLSFSIIRNNLGTYVEDSYINLMYVYTDRWTGEMENMDYRIELTTTPCRYGGKRYWFICPLNYCNRRVGVLFNIGKWFGCRHCGNIAYAKQMRGGKYRWNGISIKDIEEAEKEIKHYYYRGRPTRKYRRVIRLNEKFDHSWRMMLIHWNKHSDTSANLKKK